MTQHPPANEAAPQPDQTTASHRAIAERLVDGATTAGGVAVSPDGSQVAFTVTRAVLADNEYRSEIWLAPADGSAPARSITAGPNDALPAWSPDGSLLAFASRRGSTKRETTVHILPIGGPGEVRTIATRTDRVTELRWSPDGRWLGFIGRVPDERYDHDEDRWRSPRKIETFFTRLDGEGWIFDRPAHVHVVPVDGSGAPLDLTPGPHQHSGIAWLPDSSAIVTSAARHEGWDLDLSSHLHLVPLPRPGVDGDDHSAGIRQLTSGSLSVFAPSVSPDGTRVACLGHDDPTTIPQNVHVGVVDIDGGPVTWVSTGLDRTFQPYPGYRPPVWLDDGSLLASAEDRGRVHVFRVDASGERAPEPITTGDRWVTSFDHRSGTTAFTAARVRHPGEVFVVRDGARGDGDDELLADPGAHYVAHASPHRWERFTVPCADGTDEIDAWIMRPEGDGPFPVLLNVHGGPHTQYGETYFDEAQLQVAAGFVVVMSNPRGSSGREQSWGQAIMGPKHPVAPGTGWGGADVDDVLAVLDAALERYEFCDPERVGMLGGSYGGWMATELAGSCGDRFRGICSERAVNNMISEEWSSDIATFFRAEIGPDHLSDPDEYMRMSPIRRVDDIHTPMLLLHSEEDWRCPIVQAEELFVALRMLGRDVTFYRFPGEGHELSRSGSPVHRVQRAEIILDWFAERLAPAEAPAS